MLCSPEVFVNKERKKILMDACFEGGLITGCVTVYVIRNGMDTRGRFEKSVDFKLEGDGVRKVHEIDISEINSAFVSAKLMFTSAGHAKIYSFEFI